MTATLAQTQALEFKKKGNAAHQQGDYRRAIFLFSKGLDLSPGPPCDHILFSNRSASYCLLEDYERALQDAEDVIRLQRDWPKGYSRKAAALQNLQKFNEAIQAYEEGLRLDPGSDVMRKGLEEAKLLQEQHEPKNFNKRISDHTEENMVRAQGMNQLKEVIWHLEILKDKIWLADPPKPPFRPRSLFLIDSTRVQMLHMTAHPTRESISLDELLDFILQTCFKHGIIPSMIEFSDYKLQYVLEEPLKRLNIEVRSLELGASKQRFFDETIKSFEDKEQEQWDGNPKFAGVLRQRAQGGMLAVPGCSTFFMKYLLSSAAHFYHSKVFLYYTKSLGIYVEGTQDQTVCLITRNCLGQYGIAKSTMEAAKNITDCGSASYLFSDVSNIPFDDADLIERYGWEIAEDKYPLPMLHVSETDMSRPSLDDLKWFELAFRTLTLFLQATFATPTYIPPGELCYRCVVHTHAGKASVLVTVPPSNCTVPTHTLEEPIPPPPKEHILHEDGGLNNKKPPIPDSFNRVQTPTPVPIRPQTPSTVPAPPVEVTTQPPVAAAAPPPTTAPLPTTTAEVDADSAHHHHTPSHAAPAPPPKSIGTPAPPPPTASSGITAGVGGGGGGTTPVLSSPIGGHAATTTSSSVPRSTTPTTQIPSFGGLSTSPAPPSPMNMAAGIRHASNLLAGVDTEEIATNWRNEQAALGEYRQQWKAEQTQRHTLLHQLSGLLLLQNDETQRLQQQLAEQERVLGEVRLQLKEKDKKIKWQGDHMKSQEILIHQLQSRVNELDTANSALLKEADHKTRSEMTQSKQLLNELANHTEAIIKALSNDEEFVHQQGKRGGHESNIADTVQQVINASVARSLGLTPPPPPPTATAPATTTTTRDTTARRAASKPTRGVGRRKAGPHAHVPSPKKAVHRTASPSKPPATGLHHRLGTGSTPASANNSPTAAGGLHGHGHILQRPDVSHHMHAASASSIGSRAGATGGTTGMSPMRDRPSQVGVRRQSQTQQVTGAGYKDTSLNQSGLMQDSISEVGSNVSTNHSEMPRTSGMYPTAIYQHQQTHQTTANPPEYSPLQASQHNTSFGEITQQPHHPAPYYHPSQTFRRPSSPTTHTSAIVAPTASNIVSPQVVRGTPYGSTSHVMPQDMSTEEYLSEANVCF